MVANTQNPAQPLTAPQVHRGLLGDPTATLWSRLTSAPSLAIALLAVILLAAGPFQDIDLFLAKRWLYRIEPSLLPFAQNVLDRIAGQAVCLPILIAVASTIALRLRSWRPLLIAGHAELGFLGGVGAMKVILARGVTYERDPRFLEAGFFDMGTKGISFPSGHASEAVLIYGAAVYLIVRYTSVPERVVGWLRWLVVLIAINSVAVSFLIGWHWLSDLVGGLLAGGLFLRLIIDWDSRALERGGPRSIDGGIGGPEGHSGGGELRKDQVGIAG